MSYTTILQIPTKITFTLSLKCLFICFQWLLEMEYGYIRFFEVYWILHYLFLFFLTEVSVSCLVLLPNLLFLFFCVKCNSINLAFVFYYTIGPFCLILDWKIFIVYIWSKGSQCSRVMQGATPTYFRILLQQSRCHILLSLIAVVEITKTSICIWVFFSFSFHQHTLNRHINNTVTHLHLNVMFYTLDAIDLIMLFCQQYVKIKHVFYGFRSILLCQWVSYTSAV